MALTGYQVAESRSYQAECTWGPIGLDWVRDVEVEEEGESMADRLRQVIESPLWAWVRDVHAYDGNKVEHCQIVRTFRRWRTNENPTLLPNGQVCEMTTDNSMDSTRDV